MKKNILKEKSFLFAIRIVNLYGKICREQQEYVMSKQLLRCGTAVGASVREAEFAESFSDFVHKMAIAQKEINETVYWIEILQETILKNSEGIQQLHADAVELLRIITSSIKTVKQKLTK